MSEKSAESARTEHDCSLTPRTSIVLVLGMVFVLSFPIIVLGQSSGANQTQPTQQGPATCRRSCCRCQGDAANSGGATAFVVQQPAEKSDADSKTRLKDMVPLLQSLVWALLVGAVLIAWRRELGGILRERHIKLNVADVEMEVFPPEQVTDPSELEVVEQEGE